MGGNRNSEALKLFTQLCAYPQRVIKNVSCVQTQTQLYVHVRSRNVTFIAFAAFLPIYRRLREDSHLFFDLSFEQHSCPCKGAREPKIEVCGTTD